MMRLLLKRFRVIVFLILTGYPINLICGFALQDALMFDFGCAWIVPQLKKFEPHFSHLEICSANNALLSGYFWLATIAVWTVLFSIVCATIYPGRLIEHSRMMVSAKNAGFESAGYRLATSRPPQYVYPLILVALLGMHPFKGFEFGRLGRKFLPENYTDVLQYAQGQVLFVHTFFGFCICIMIWMFVAELVVWKVGE
jgi:hypothetical protein